MIGTWSLKEAFAVDGDGRRLYDVYGTVPTGFITYCADRRMMALITHDGRSFLDGDRQSAPDGQKVEAYTSSIAYAGTYDFDGKTVVHHIEASTYPNWVGTNLVRLVKINDDHVCLRTLPQMQNGVLVVIELIWTPVAS